MSQSTRKHISSRPWRLTIAIASMLGPLEPAARGQIYIPFDCDLFESQRIERSERLFGDSIALHGNAMVVGAPEATRDPFGVTGIAHAYDRDGQGRWVHRAAIIASDTTEGDRFGCAVSMEGDTLVIGARYADGNEPEAGAAYVFLRNAQGEWTERKKIVAPDGTSRDSFGDALSISGDKLIVGAPNDGELGFSSGSIYFFARGSQEEWVFVNKALASDGSSSDTFGGRVDISGDRAIVSAHWNNGGTAYVFERGTNGLWTERARLRNPTGISGYFSWAVSISGDRLVVTDYSSPVAGRAFVFGRDGAGNWTHVSTLVAWNPQPLGQLGRAVAIDGDRILVGAAGNSYLGEGSAYVFVDEGENNWVLARRLIPSDYRNVATFGMRLALDGSSIAVTDFAYRKIYAYDADDPRCLPIIRLEGECPGAMAIRVLNASPFGEVGFLFGQGFRYTVPRGLPCAGTYFEIGGGAIGWRRALADENGEVTVRFRIPSNECGVYRVQAIDGSTCQVTNFVRIR